MPKITKFYKENDIIYKQCSKCNKFLSLENYCKGSKNSLFQTDPRCRICRHIIQKRETNPNYVYNGCKISKRQTISDDFLVDLNKKENVYLLGLFWADGHVSGKSRIVTYACKAEDFEYNRKLFNYFNILNIREYFYCKKDGQNYGKPQCSICISKESVYNFLKENDYIIKSSGISPTKILSKIPEHLRHYWFRGYFDGDGCASLTKCKTVTITFSSCKEQDWNFMLNLTKQIQIQKFYQVSEIRKDNGYGFSTFGIAKSNEVYKFFNYIYPKMEFDNIGYERKFNKLEQVKNIFGKTRTNKYEYVIFDKNKNKWQSSVKINGLRKYIGSFVTEEDAYLAQQNSLNHLVP